jgi:hypothetical protein
MVRQLLAVLRYVLCPAPAVGRVAPLGMGADGLGIGPFRVLLGAEAGWGLPGGPYGRGPRIRRVRVMRLYGKDEG